MVVQTPALWSPRPPDGQSSEPEIAAPDRPILLPRGTTLEEEAELGKAAHGGFARARGTFRAKGHKLPGFDAIEGPRDHETPVDEHPREHLREHRLRTWAKTRAGKRVLVGAALGGIGAAGLGIPHYKCRKAKEAADEKAADDRKRAEQEADRHRRQEAAARPRPQPPSTDPPEMQEQARLAASLPPVELERMAKSDPCGSSSSSTDHTLRPKPCPNFRYTGGKWVSLAAPDAPSAKLPPLPPGDHAATQEQERQAANAGADELVRMARSDPCGSTSSSTDCRRDFLLLSVAGMLSDRLSSRHGTPPTVPQLAVDRDQVDIHRERDPAKIGASVAGSGVWAQGAIVLLMVREAQRVLGVRSCSIHT